MRKTILAGLLILTALLASACGAGTTIQPTADVNAARTSAAQTVIAELTLTAADFTPTLRLSPTALTPETPEITVTVAITNTTAPIMVTDATSGVPIQITATPVLCDSMTFDPNTVDINYPDSPITQMTPGQEFVKTWRIRNNGSCAWNEDYGLIFSHGEKMSGVPEPLGTVVQVGQEVEVSVSLKAPARAAEYASAWVMANDRGIPFGDALYVRILVK